MNPFSFKVSNFQNFKVPKFQSFKVSEFQSFKVSKFQSFKVSMSKNSKYWNSKVPKFEKSQSLKVKQFQSLELWKPKLWNFGRGWARRRGAARGGAGRRGARCEALRGGDPLPGRLGASSLGAWAKSLVPSTHQARQAKPAFGSAGRRPALPECFAVLAGVKLITSRDLG